MADIDQAGDLAERLRTHVQRLAGEIGERNVFRPEALDDAAALITGEWRKQGYRVVSQVYPADGLPCANLEITRAGRTRPREIILVGAHYDSVIGSPGANDNASGVAALLEISRLLAETEPQRTVRLVAFVNEEPPFFATRQMGSHVYAGAARARRDDIRLMLALETIGYYSEEPRSQHYPPLFNFFYPDRANFIAFVSNLRSRRLLRRALGAFRARSDFPVQSLAMFPIVPGVAWSDHLSFWRRGYRALMVTDTAFYRYPHYHTEGDTPDKLAYEGLARVTVGIWETVADLATESR